MRIPPQEVRGVNSSQIPYLSCFLTTIDLSKEEIAFPFEKCWCLN